MSFIRLARTARLPLVILDVQASDTTLRARISERARQQNDPSEATLDVLDHQLRTQEPLAPDEVALAIRIDSESSLDIQRVAAKILSRKALGSS
jgi:predicted kinase